MFLGSVLVVVAAALLWIGAELFVDNASSAGKRLGVTGLAVGLLLAGAEPEEFVTAAVAALRDRGGIAAGDAIGANITMLTLVLGLAAFLAPIPVAGRVRRYLVGAAIFGGAAALLIPGGVGRWEGTALLVLYVAGVTYVWVKERRPPAIGELAELEDGEEEEDEEGRWTALVLVIAGIAVMSLGGWVAVLGAERLVDSLGVLDSVIGLSVVALATTAELFALVLAAHRHEVSELGVAGIVGSASYNATVTLGGAALLRPLDTAGIGWAGVLGAFLPILIVTLGGKRGVVGRPAGTVLVVVYATYLAVLFT